MLMAVPSGELSSEVQTDRHPLLMDRNAEINGNEHVINIPRGNIASTSGSHGGNLSESEESGYVNAPSTSVPASISHASTVSPIASNSRNNSLTRRGDNYGRRGRSPLNSGLWISVELVVNLAQILAAIIVLSVSRNEHPKAPLFEWIIGYTAGCVATLPHLYWRYIHRNGQISEQDSQLSNSITQNNPVESSTYTAISVNQNTQQDNLHGNVAVSHVGQNFLTTNSRINSLVDHFKMALDCFFAVWFVVGNVWIFGGHSSSDAPNLYKLCIVFLTFSCIGYAMPFILCALICCCLPCIISIMGFREDMTQNRGATTESINSLPTYKFKIKSQKSREPTEIDSENQGDGIFAPGTDKERIISAEDAVCCICLTKYVDDDELRELPCAHFFHMDCVDKWLKINALCPLCKTEVGNSAVSLSTTTATRHHSDSRVGDGAT